MLTAYRNCPQERPDDLILLSVWQQRTGPCHAFPRKSEASVKFTLYNYCHLLGVGPADLTWMPESLHQTFGPFRSMPRTD